MAMVYINKFHKTELIRWEGPRRTVEQVELATPEYVRWWNNQRLHGELDLRTLLEIEPMYYADLEPARYTKKRPPPTRPPFPPEKLNHNAQQKRTIAQATSNHAKTSISFRASKTITGENPQLDSVDWCLERERGKVGSCYRTWSSWFMKFGRCSQPRRGH